MPAPCEKGCFHWPKKENAMLQRQTVLSAVIAAGVIAFGSYGYASQSGTSLGAGPAASSSVTVSQAGGYGGGMGTSGGMGAAPAAGAVVFMAVLSPSEEVPPAANSKGQGTAEVRVDPATNELTYTVSFNGLTGPATMAHIHGPTSPGCKAPVVVPFKEVTGGVEKASGKGKLTQAQYGDLAAGQYYVNVHTAQYPGGEICGQLKKQ